MSEQPNPQQKEKEIDLLNVSCKMFSATGRGIKCFVFGIKNMILWFLRLTKKYFWILAALTILGAIGGYAKAKLQRPFYQTEMLVETQIISRTQIADRINNLQHLVKDKNHNALARELGLQADDVKDIFFIKADLVRITVERAIDRSEGEVDAGEHIGPQFLRIRIRVWDNQKISKMGRALVTFIENDPYTQERLAIYRKNNLMQQEAIQMEIRQLELFQKKNIEKSSSVMTNFGNTPLVVQNEERTYISEILHFKNQILALQAAYELTRPLSIIQPFTPFDQPVNRTLFNTILFSLLAVGLGYGFLLFREGWKRLKPLLDEEPF
ncbi:MAG: hypothetical protein FWE63_05415 [Bacteroidales bacterium]|nr:hypothetical protein [Bacteroidales bacterium]